MDLDTSPGSRLWYVVHCQTKKESCAASILSNQLELTVYLPKIQTQSRQQTRYIPFFPGYFFIQVDLQKVALSCINSVPGILRLLDFGDGPLTLPPSLIELLQEETNRYNAYNSQALQRLSCGDEVRITTGPLKGLTAILTESATSSERVQVLLHFLGRLSKVQVGIQSLEKRADQPLQRERQTRGKGRRIHRNNELFPYESYAAVHPRIL
jgi:transcriptional antiterminator RfaH